MLRRVLREQHAQRHFKVDNALCESLLKYALEDGKYSDLNNVPLLPLENDTVATFSTHGARQMYFLGTPKAYSILEPVGEF